jgi:prepilin-type N-terminal cleavage/methylation domain-containing protein
MGHRKPQGFTLVEILVVVGILALLLAVLVPVVRRAQVSAQETAVKAQQQNISSGLEMFKSDFGYYPSSTPQNAKGVDLVNPWDFDITEDVILGFHRMAFALVGRDKLGCPAKRGTGAYPSGYTGANPGPDSLAGWYYSYTSSTARGKFDAAWVNYDGTIPANWAAANRTPRKTPYINPEGFSIVNDDTALSNSNTYVPVICDKLDQKKGENITLPASGLSYQNMNRSVVLYFAVNPRGLRITTPAVTTAIPSSEWSQEYYYMMDNFTILARGNAPSFPNKGTDDTNQKWFGGEIEDKSAQVVNEHMPHNKDGYILISPGADLQYMTKDDIVNWNK